MPAKSIVLASASGATEDDPDVRELIKLRRYRRPQLHNLIGFFKRQEKEIFSVQDLARRGVTAIALPNADSLLSDGGYFRPHPIFHPNIKVDTWDIEDASPKEEWLNSHSGHVLGTLYSKIQKRLYDKVHPGIPAIDREHGPCATIGLPSPFFGVIDGLYRSAEGEHSWMLHRLREWRDPESEEAIRIPHVNMSVSHICDPPGNTILGSEMRGILTVLYNRVYQPGFEDASEFPILYISGYMNRQLRIVEAVFDLPHQKLTLKFTPHCSFLKRKEAPWDLFFRMYASSPHTVEDSPEVLSKVLKKTDKKKSSPKA